MNKVVFGFGAILFIVGLILAILYKDVVDKQKDPKFLGGTIGGGIGLLIALIGLWLK